MSSVGETKKTPAAPEPAPLVRDDLGVEVARAPRRCPFCHEDVAAGARVVACEQCLALHHESCWREGGACSSCRHERSLVPAGPRPGTGRRLALVALGLVASALLALVVSNRPVAREPASTEPVGRKADEARPAPKPTGVTFKAPVGSVAWEERRESWRHDGDGDGEKTLTTSRFENPAVLHRWFSGESTLAELGPTLAPYDAKNVEEVGSRVEPAHVLSVEQLAVLSKEVPDLDARSAWLLTGGHFGANSYTVLSTDPRAVVVLATSFASHGSLYAEGPIVFLDATTENWLGDAVSREAIHSWGEPRVGILAAPPGRVHVYTEKQGR